MLKIKSIVENLQLEPYFNDGFKPTNKKNLELLTIEFEGELPKLYYDLLISFGPVSCPDNMIYPFSSGGIYIGDFLGDIFLDRLDEIADRLPNGLIPISDDGGDNWVCISVRNDNTYGIVYYSSHSMGFEHDHDQSRLKALLPISNSFEEFMAGLIIAK